MRRVVALALALLAAGACKSKPRDRHAIAADALTATSAKSRLADWQMHATAMGPDCDVLQIETNTVMEPSMIDALHYGYGYYHLHEGGIQQFYRERGFRAVFYRDRTGHVWTYDIEEPEVKTLVPCK